MNILVDANSLAHRARHSLGELTNETIKVGVIFGFLAQIQKLAKDNDTPKIAFCWDAQSSHRLKVYPAYKERRRTQKEEKTPEEKEEDKLAYAQFDQLHEYVLPEIGYVNNFKLEGFEADDLIASVVYSNSDEDFIIASGDEDMYQLLSEGVSIKNAKGYYTVEDFRKEYRIEPHQWIDVKAMAGCTSDGIPGIKGIGEDTAIKFLRKELTPNRKGYQSIMSPEGRATKALFKKIVALPFTGCPDIVLKKQPQLSLDGFMKICQEFGFEYYLKKDNLTKWKQILNLK